MLQSLCVFYVYMQPPDANKTPTKVSPIKESLHNATNQIVNSFYILK